MNIVYPNGSKEITVPAGEKIALYSLDHAKLYQRLGYPNQPASWDLVYTTVAGTEYLSSAFTYETVVLVEPSAAQCYYEVGAAPSIFEPLANQSMSAAAATITGLAAAAGGSVTIKGGTSSTAGNAGGVAALLGGQPGVTGVGGAVTITGGAGGATSGTGGAATVTGGAGTNGNAIGGAAVLVGGAGQGTAAGGAIALTGGASGAGATGNGGKITLTGGAAASTDGAGGSIVLQPGALAGTGLNGGVFNRGTYQFKKQAAQVDKVDGNQSVTGIQIIGGICVHTITTGRTLTTPTGALITSACPADLAVGDSFDFTLITIGAGADDIDTLTAGDGDVTIVGEPTVGPSGSTFNCYGTFKFRYSGANAWIAYRVG
jgi:hypothetical protein